MFILETSLPAIGGGNGDQPLPLNINPLPLPGDGNNNNGRGNNPSPHTYSSRDVYISSMSAGSTVSQSARLIYHANYGGDLAAVGKCGRFVKGGGIFASLGVIFSVFDIFNNFNYANKLEARKEKILMDSLEGLNIDSAKKAAIKQALKDPSNDYQALRTLLAGDGICLDSARIDQVIDRLKTTDSMISEANKNALWSIGSAVLGVAALALTFCVPGGIVVAGLIACTAATMGIEFFGKSHLDGSSNVITNLFTPQLPFEEEENSVRREILSSTRLSSVVSATRN